MEHENTKPPIQLYHFTTFENFLSILKTNELRFSRIDRVNDLSETIIRSHKVFNRNEVEDYLRGHIKMLSFTKDTYNHQRMWAQYAGHNGVCIGINYQKFIEENKEKFLSLKIIKGEIQYLSQYKQEDKLDFGNQTKSSRPIGQDEMIDFVCNNAQTLLFRKDKDWANEQEYRFIAFSQNPISFSLKDAVECVYLGEHFLPLLGCCQKIGEKGILLQDFFHVYSLRIGVAVPLIL